MEPKINLGDEVVDTVTGFSGVVICRMTWLHGCDRLIVQPKGTNKEGKRFENDTFDEPQLKVVRKNKVKEGDHKTGGPTDRFVSSKP